MPSVDLLDPTRAVRTAPDVRDLLVIWQHPLTRQLVPVGRFAYDGQNYSFVYTRAAAQVEDFRPLPGLGDLNGRFESTRLPAAFGLRVMDAERADYAEYMRSLGLDPLHATPWEQIVRSGGARAGDTLQFMQTPSVNEGHARACFLVNGVRYIPGRVRLVGRRRVDVTVDRHERALRSLVPGDRLLLEPEDGNSEDPFATLVMSGGTPLGYVPRALSVSTRELMARGPVRPTVVRVAEPGTPPHLRLVVVIDVVVPPNFEFDREGLWEPVGPQ